MNLPIKAIDYDQVPPGEWISPDLFEGINLEQAQPFAPKKDLSLCTSGSLAVDGVSRNIPGVALPVARSTSSDAHSQLRFCSLKRSIRIDEKEFHNTFDELVIAGRNHSANGVRGPKGMIDSQRPLNLFGLVIRPLRFRRCRARF